MKLEKIMQKLGKDTVEEMESMSETELKETIVQAEQSQKAAKAELERNPEYVRAKNDMNAFKVGLNEVNARQKAKIAFALHLLEEKGQV